MWAIASVVQLGFWMGLSLVAQAQPADIGANQTDAGLTTTTTSRADATVVNEVFSPEEFLASITQHLPDPEEELAIAEEKLASAKKPGARAAIERLIARLRVIERPHKLHLTLEDARRRALTYNYAIRVSSYNPAIEATRVVEAEAAFDATFFMNITNNKQDRPSINLLAGTSIQTFDASSGIRKLLPTGMQVEASYITQRSSNNFQFQTINPIWFSQFAVQFRQPLLRGFGLDMNRSQIRLSKLNRRSVNQQFRRDIRDTLRSVEEAYWRLVSARRNLVVSARLLSSFEQIHHYLIARQDFDVYSIQLADTKARLESSVSDYIELAANVRNAEDQLIALMNDPSVDLADDTEIIPVDLPSYAPIILDHVAEVQTALENRSEVIEAKVGIDSAKIQVGVAKNQALPKLDLTFRYAVDGTGVSHRDSFSEVSRNNFMEYLVGIEFEIPVGNRAPRALLHRAKLQYAQALAGLKQVFEQVILDVNVSIRQVEFKFDQIEPRLRTADATQKQVSSIIARAEKKDFLTLNNELNTRQSLAQSRSALLTAFLDYRMAITDLERAKGTLLRHDGVDLILDDTNDPTH